MGIEQRLLALRSRQSIALPQAADNLATRIHRLRSGGRVGGREPEAQDRRLASALGGRVVAPGLLRLERRLPLSSSHGIHRLSILNQPLDGLPGPADLEPSRLLFLDTETTGLSGGSGTLVFMLGMARLDRSGLVVRQYLLSRYCGERNMLRESRAWASAGMTLVTYNGRTFDLPLLAARCRMNLVAESYDSFAHLDLLYLTRRAFSSRWQNCRLSTAERLLLGYRRSWDLPGAEAPRAWIDWIGKGEWGQLQRVCSHNLQDLVSLAVLLPVLSAVYRDPESRGGDLLGVARGHLKAGDEERALGLLRGGASSIGEAGQRELARLLERKQRRSQIPLVNWPTQHTATSSGPGSVSADS